jgi:hypothetical protein
VFDSEILCVDAHGKPHFTDFSAPPCEPPFFAFDLLMHDDQPKQVETLPSQWPARAARAPASHVQAAERRIIRGAMGNEDEAIEKLQKALAEVQVSLNVLKAYVSIQMSPDAPLDALKQLAVVEKTIAGVVDPNEQGKKQALEAAAVLRDWIRQRRRTSDS